MAQLIKLQDYVSRYEKNVFHYPSKYIQLKKENWTKMKERYNLGLLESLSTDLKEDKDESEHQVKWKQWFRKRLGEERIEDDHKPISNTPKSMEELKQFYLDGLIPFQLRWASTTLLEKSFLDSVYHEDQQLKFYLQRIPDIICLCTVLWYT